MYVFVSNFSQARNEEKARKMLGPDIDLVSWLPSRPYHDYKNRDSTYQIFSSKMCFRISFLIRMLNDHEI
jgi:hypothetical protein